MEIQKFQCQFIASSIDMPGVVTIAPDHVQFEPDPRAPKDGECISNYQIFIPIENIAECGSIIAPLGINSNSSPRIVYYCQIFVKPNVHNSAPNMTLNNNQHSVVFQMESKDECHLSTETIIKLIDNILHLGEETTILRKTSSPFLYIPVYSDDEIAYRISACLNMSMSHSTSQSKEEHIIKEETNTVKPTRQSLFSRLRRKFRKKTENKEDITLSSDDSSLEYSPDDYFKSLHLKWTDCFDIIESDESAIRYIQNRYGTILTDDNHHYSDYHFEHIHQVIGKLTTLSMDSINYLLFMLPPFLMDVHLFDMLREYLPISLKFEKIYLLFTPKIHGTSLHSLYRHSANANAYNGHREQDENIVARLLKSSNNHIDDNTTHKKKLIHQSSLNSPVMHTGNQFLLAHVKLQNTSDNNCRYQYFIIGGYCINFWEQHGHHHRFYGGGDAFVFVCPIEDDPHDNSCESVCLLNHDHILYDELKFFPWTGTNSLFQFCDDDAIVIGGNSIESHLHTSAAIAIFDEFKTGLSGPCSTFGNEYSLFDYWCLGGETGDVHHVKYFDIIDLELWYF